MQRQSAAAALFAIAAFLLAGCRTLPDAQPFADATAELQTAVASSGRAVEQELRTLAASYPGDHGAQLTAHADQFEKDWRVRNEIMAAVSDYADATAAIVSAGREGQESARALAGSLENLLSTVEARLPAKAVDVFAFAYGKVAEMRAARSLEEALAAAQPAVDRLAAILDRDLSALADVTTIVRADAPDALATAEWNAARDAMNAAGARRQRIIGELARVWRDRGPLDEQLAALAPDAGPPADAVDAIERLEQLARREQRLAEELAAIDAMIRQLTATKEPVDTQVAAALGRLDDQRRLIAAARDGVRAWAAAHGKLLAAVRTSRPVNVRSLVESVAEIRELIRTVRAS